MGVTKDVSAIQESGTAVIPIGVPMRYTHSPVEVVHADDIDNFVKLLVAVHSPRIHYDLLYIFLETSFP